MAKIKHTHRYERATLGKDYVIFKCNLPGCTHYISKILAKGRMTLCNRCNEPMILNAAAMQFKKPHCLDCTKKKNEMSEHILEFLR